MTDTTKTSPAPRRPRKMAREPKAEGADDQISIVNSVAGKESATPAKHQTKASLVEALMRNGDGASIDELCRATGWLPHTCRAFLTGLRKKGKVPERAKREDGTTIYRLNPADAGSDNDSVHPEQAVA